MQVVSGFFIGLVGIVFTVVMLLLLAATARRVMGASVGWIRSAVVAFAMLSVASWVLTNGLLDAGWSRADGTLTVAPGVALAAVLLAVDADEPDEESGDDLHDRHSSRRHRGSPPHTPARHRDGHRVARRGMMELPDRSEPR